MVTIRTQTERFPKHARRIESLMWKRERIVEEKDKQQTKRNAPSEFHGMGQFVRLFGTEQQCAERLERRRWANGVYCPYCGTHDAQRMPDNYNFSCNACTEIFNVRTLSIFDLGNTGLPDWFMAMYLENSFIGGVTTGELERQIPLCRKTLGNMIGHIREYGYNQHCFSKVVEVKDKDGNNAPKIYIIDVMVNDGNDLGRHNYRKHSYYGGTERFYILTITQVGGYTFSYIIESESANCVLPIIYAHIPNGAIIITDQHKAYSELSTGLTPFNTQGKVFTHYTNNHSKGEYGKLVPFVTVNTATKKVTVKKIMVSSNPVENYHSHYQTGLAKFRNSITAFYGYRYTRAGNFRYNTRYLNESEKLDLLIDNIFAHPVEKKQAQPKYKRTTLLEKDKQRMARRKAGIKTPKELKAEEKAGRDERRIARKKRQAEQEARRIEKREKRQAKELEKQTKRETKAQKKRAKELEKQAKKNARLQRQLAKQSEKQAKKEIREQKKLLKQPKHTTKQQLTKAKNIISKAVITPTTNRTAKTTRKKTTTTRRKKVTV